MIIINFFSKRKKYLSKISDFFDVLNSFDNQHITLKIQKNLLRKYRPIYSFFKINFKNKKIRKFLKLYSNLEDFIQLHNSIYLKTQLNHYEDLLNNIDGKSLDLQQKMAVLSDETNNLVIARCWKWKNFDHFWQSKIFDRIKKGKI